MGLLRPARQELVRLAVGLDEGPAVARVDLVPGEGAQLDLHVLSASCRKVFFKDENYCLHFFFTSQGSFDSFDFDTLYEYVLSLLCS